MARQNASQTTNVFESPYLQTSMSACLGDGHLSSFQTNLDNGQFRDPNLKMNDNGPFLTANQSMFTEIEWHCRAHYNLCPTLHKKTGAFCL